jgi:hypothetical protein
VAIVNDDLDLDDARKRYHFALAPEDYERLPFYSALLGQLEHDDVALGLLAGVRVEQRNPMLVLAALQLAGLKGHPVLGAIYAAARGGELEEPEGAARDVLAVIRETPDVIGDELWRSTQTNEPGRSAVIQAVVRELSVTSAAINVIEVGTSAGINLCFDQFPVRKIDDANPLTLVCDDVTPIDRKSPLPDVAMRIGIDPYPLDLANDDDRMWLKACIWPEQRRRHERFDAVVASRPSWPKATVLTGRALERLDDAMTLVDSNVMTVIFNTWVAFYLSPEEQRDYFNDVIARCANNNVAWISVESTLIPVPGVEVDEAAHVRGASQVVAAAPRSAPVLWGWCHAHGRWLERVTTS